jgi:CDP-glucose 4,6-dehydratase
MHASSFSAGRMSFWSDRPVLVTGASGLIGSWVVHALLESGASVIILVRDWVPRSELTLSGLMENVTLVRGSLQDQALLERALGEYEVDTVIHLGAQTIVGVANRNPVSTFESNIRGTWCLLEACRRSPAVKQIVVASSDKAYGQQEHLPYTEDMPLTGQHPYDVSKSCADLLAQSYARTYDLPVVISRCGNFYGGGDLNWNRIVPGTIRSVLRGTAPVIRSNGKLIRDYLYVDDGVDAYLLLAQMLATHPSLRGEAFNFSTETPLTVLAVVEHILTHMKSSLVPVIRNTAPHEIEQQYLSAAKARSTLGWKPRFQMGDGLPHTIQWYRDYFAHANKR